MKGIGILTHAIGMVLGNLGPALRISGLLMAFQFALVVGLGLQVLYLSIDPVQMQHIDPLDAVLPAAAPLLWLVQLFSALWIAVAWHRFILCEEAPVGIVPHFRGRVMLRYLGVGLLYVLILLLAAIPLFLLAFLLIGPAALVRPGWWPMAVFLGVVWLPLVFIAYRLAPILPAAALGERLQLKEAWYRTGTAGLALVVLALASGLLYALASLPLAPLARIAPTLAFLWGFALHWASLMVGASVLTTLYGHFIEDRPLNA
ncbi:MAG: hypothetical protein JJT95_02850 [Pararhodobacter sp.]|nr:hypothetical protein [Pararhodobacter sp.]